MLYPLSHQGSHCGATVCRSPGAAVPACSLWRSPWGLPHLLLRDPALPTNHPKEAGSTPSSSPTAEKGWGSPALPSPGLLGTEWRRHGHPELVKTGGHLAALNPCGCSPVLRVPAHLGVRESGVPQGLEPLSPGSAQGTISQPEVRGCIYSSVYMSSSSLRIPRKLFSPSCTWDGGAGGKEPACQRRRHKRLGFNFWVGKSPWRR